MVGGWMDGLVYGWMMDWSVDGWMDDGWLIYGWMGAWMCGWLNGWMSGWVGVWVDKWMGGSAACGPYTQWCMPHHEKE